MEYALWLYPLIFVSSFVLSMAGLGGGLIFAPLFLLVGFAQSSAVASSLLLNALAATTASYVYIRKRMVDFSLSIPLVISSGLAAPIGAMCTRWVDESVFLSVMSVVLFLAAVRMMFVGGVAGQGTRAHVWSLSRVLQASFLGLVIGFMAGMLGIGGGIFVVPLLIYLLQVNPRTAAATTAFIVCFSSYAGFATHVAVTPLDWKFLVMAGIFSSAGGLAGSRLMSSRLSGAFVRKLFALVLFFLSLHLMYQGVFT